MMFGKKQNKQLRKSTLRVESLEDRMLLAVYSGIEAGANVELAAPQDTGAPTVNISDLNASTLRSALRSVTAGGTITYDASLAGQTVDLNDGYGTITISKNVTINGNGVTFTNSVAGGKGHIFEIAANCTSVTLQNLTLTGGSSSGYSYDQDQIFPAGGALYCWNTNCGGATSTTVNLALDNVSLCDNTTAYRGGAAWLYGVTLTMTNCTVSGNTAGAGEGGALFLLCCNATIDNCTFTDNSAGWGGAVDFDTSYNVSISNSTFDGNHAYGYTLSDHESDWSVSAARGGALYFNATQNAILDNCTITNNQATNASNLPYCGMTEGGGLYISDSNVTGNYCQIACNVANHALSCKGGGVYISGDGKWESKESTGTVRFNMTKINDNVIGQEENIWTGDYAASNLAYKGGAVYARGSLTLVDCLVVENSILGSRANGELRGSAVYTQYDAGKYSQFVAYYTTFAGNMITGVGSGFGIDAESSAIWDWGGSTLFGSVLLGNYSVATATGAKTENEFFSRGCVENGIALSRIQSSAINKSAMAVINWGLTHGYTYGTYYKDASYTQVSTTPTNYLLDDNVNTGNVNAFFKDFNAGDYSLAAGSAGIDAMNTDIQGSAFGYEYDIRGEGYYRVVNDIIDLGVYEFQAARPTFDVTLTGWTGDYDGNAHSVTVGGLQSGDVVYYSADGTNYSTTKLTYTDPGTYTTYVKVTRAGYQDWTGSAAVTINEVVATTKLSVMVVVSNAAASATQLSTLPSSISTANVGDTVYAQVWIKNADGSANGCTGGYIDLAYSNANLTAGTYNVSSIYNQEANRADASVVGNIADFGGCAASGVNDLAVSQWALLGTYTFTASTAGTATVTATAPTLRGRVLESLNLARSGEGCIKNANIDYNAASFTVQQGGGGEQLAAPTISNSSRSNYISYGANRHQLQWNAVEHASGYEVSYSQDGGAWQTITVAGTSAVIKNLTYGADVQYKVKALGTGSYTDSAWSRVKEFNVCPMDINGDGDIAGMDRTLLVNGWMSEEGDEEYHEYLDIDGDGEVSGKDRSFLAANWQMEAGDADLTYPRAVRADAVTEAFASGIEVDLDVF